MSSNLALFCGFSDLFQPVEDKFWLINQHARLWRPSEKDGNSSPLNSDIPVGCNPRTWYQNPRILLVIYLVPASGSYNWSFQNSDLQVIDQDIIVKVRCYYYSWALSGYCSNQKSQIFNVTVIVHCVTYN